MPELGLCALSLLLGPLTPCRSGGLSPEDDKGTSDFLHLHCPRSFSPADSQSQWAPNPAISALLEPPSRASWGSSCWSAVSQVWHYGCTPTAAASKHGSPSRVRGSGAQASQAPGCGVREREAFLGLFRKRCCSCPQKLVISVLRIAPVKLLTMCREWRKTL